MAVYIGHDECQVIYVAKNGQQLRVSSVWVGDQQVFPPANRQEIHVFTRDTQGYGRVDGGSYFGFGVPMPWWATAVDVVLIGAGEKGIDGTKSFTGGSDGAGGRSGAWVVKTSAVPNALGAYIQIAKGNSVSPHYTDVAIANKDGTEVRIWDGEGTRTANSGSTGGSVTPLTRTEFMQSHTGGLGGSRNNPGKHPGGGGGGGQGSGLVGNPTTGQPGGDGYVWLRFRSAPALTPGDEEFVLLVGVISGVAYAPLREWAVGIGKTHQTITEITVPMEVVGPSLQSLFADCRALTTIPELDTSQVTNMSSMFRYCQELTTIPELDTSQVTNMYGMFTNCSALTTIPALDARQVTNMSTMFTNCSSLESVTLPGMGNGFTSKQTLGMKDTKLNAAAANALMQSLGTVPAAANGTKMELPATAAGANTTIATAKNWTVTIG